jgi:hypothetical protein
MRGKKMATLYAIFIYFATSSVLCQSSVNYSCLYNDSLKYNLFRPNLKLVDSNVVEISPTRVEVVLRNADRKKLENLKRSEWIKLLSDEKTDWAANIFLYDITKKDASTFEVVQNKEAWRKCCKANDLDFWKKTLKD